MTPSHYYTLHIQPHTSRTATCCCWAYQPHSYLLLLGISAAQLPATAGYTSRTATCCYWAYQPHSYLLLLGIPAAQLPAATGHTSRTATCCCWAYQPHSYLLLLGIPAAQLPATAGHNSLSTRLIIIILSMILSITCRRLLSSAHVCLLLTRQAHHNHYWFHQ